MKAPGKLETRDLTWFPFWSHCSGFCVVFRLWEGTGEGGGTCMEAIEISFVDERTKKSKWDAV